MAQNRRHSQWEVGLDFCLSIVINLGIQALFLPTFALSRGVSFTGTFLTLALVRRYMVRRGFNWLVQPGAVQTRGMSLLESWTDTILAMAMAFGIATLWYPEEPLPYISVLIVLFYSLTMLRRYLLRRYFEGCASKQ